VVSKMQNPNLAEYFDSVVGSAEAALQKANEGNYLLDRLG
jgi:hypothetical protein